MNVIGAVSVSDVREVALGGGYVWAANDTGIWKLASDGRVLGTISVPSQTANIYFGAGAL